MGGSPLCKQLKTSSYRHKVDWTAANRSGERVSSGRETERETDREGQRMTERERERERELLSHPADSMLTGDSGEQNAHKA